MEYDQIPCVLDFPFYTMERNNISTLISGPPYKMET